MSECAIGCVQRDRHLTTCGDREECRGCLPRLTDDGSAVCQTCADRARDAHGAGSAARA